MISQTIAIAVLSAALGQDERAADRAAILEGAKAFADSGGKLVRLEFPKTELQVYGNTIIVYTTYVYEIEAGGKRTTKAGRGTEIFVRRSDGELSVGPWIGYRVERAGSFV